MIKIYSRDIHSRFYWICSKSDKKMYGSLSGKKDFIGGIFDRWINTISENIIFNEYFLPKISTHLMAINDYYIYDPQKAGIAPDLIGVKINEVVIPFAKYGNNGWYPYQNAPQIEVKTFKNEQYMVSLRDQGYKQKYLVLLEMALNSDYLLPFFKDNVLSNDVYLETQMDDSVFLDASFTGIINQPTKLIVTDEIGTLSLIAVTNAGEFMNRSDLCKGGESPHYIKEIRQTKLNKGHNLNHNLKDYCRKVGKTYQFKRNWYKLLTHKIDIQSLSWRIKNINQIKIVKLSQSTVTLRIGKKDAEINGIKLIANTGYIVKFSYIDRSSNNNKEYFMHKSIIKIVSDYEDNMMNDIRNHINSNT